MGTLFRPRLAAWLCMFPLCCTTPTQTFAQNRMPVRIGIQPSIVPESIVRAQGKLEKRYGDRFDFQWINVTHAAAAIEAMAAGSLDITHAGSIPLMQAYERGVSIWAVADGVGDVVGIVVRPDASIKSPADLKGKTLAFPGKGSVPYALIELAIAGTDVRVDEMTLVLARFPEMPLILERKAVDGFAGVEPFISMVASNGEGRILVRTSDKLKVKEGTFIGGEVGVRREFARKHPDALKAFLSEFQEASRFITKNPEQAADIFGRVFPGVVTRASFDYALKHGLVYFKDTRPKREEWTKMVEFTNKSKLTRIANPDEFLKGFLHPEFNP